MVFDRRDNPSVEPHRSAGRLFPPRSPADFSAGTNRLTVGTSRVRNISISHGRPDPLVQCRMAAGVDVWNSPFHKTVLVLSCAESLAAADFFRDLKSLPLCLPYRFTTDFFSAALIISGASIFATSARKIDSENRSAVSRWSRFTVNLLFLSCSRRAEQFSTTRDL